MPVVASRAGECHSRGVRSQFSSIPIISNSVSGAIRPPLLQSQAHITNGPIYEKHCISTAGMRILRLATSKICFVEAAAGSHERNFLPHVPCETLGYKTVSLNPHMGARFCKCDS